MTVTRDIEETAHEIRRRIQPQIREAAQRIDTVNDQMTAYIRENPVKCLLGALALGVVIGKLASR